MTINFKLSSEELREIEQAVKHASQPEVRHRATAIHLLHKGQRPEEVAGVMAVKPTTVYQWYHRWRAEGVEGLVNRAKGGRPRKATEGYCELLAEVLESEPSEWGYDFSLWTVERLRAHLYEQTGVSLSAGRLRALMKQQGYRYRRPKHDLTDLQDPQARQAAHEIIEWLKKTPSPGPSSSSLWTKQP
jgi:transposase